jgi:hypothetical protein
MAGNWKMNPTSLQDVESLSALLRTTAENLARDKPDLDVEVGRSPSCPRRHLSTHTPHSPLSPPDRSSDEQMREERFGAPAAQR